MNVSVIGSGRWGSFIAWYLDKIVGEDVMLYGMKGAADIEFITKNRRTEIVEYSDKIIFTTDISKTLNFADTIVISVGSQNFRGLLAEMSEYDIDGKTLVLCMKGLEIPSGKRLTEVCGEVLGERCKVAVWVGPGHVEDFSKGVPNCMVIDSESGSLKKKLVAEFSSDLIRFYYGTDLVGTEIGAAAKNVIGIAAGMLDGINRSALKGALMSRGTREVARLIEACGGNPLSAYGLAHLGDYEATVFSAHSHNRMFGEMLVKGESYDKLAEGYYTAKSMVELGREYNVDLPICSAVYRVLYEGESFEEAMANLFVRSLKHEF